MMTSEFGELKLRNDSPSGHVLASTMLKNGLVTEGELKTPVTDITNGFSTIDLNGSAQSPEYESYNPINGSDVSYVSFDAAANSQAAVQYHVGSGGDGLNRVGFNSSSASSSSPQNSSSSYSPMNSSSSSVSDVSAKLASKTVTTIENIKQWSKSAYKCTRQMVSERLGKSSRTVDPEVEKSIEHIRDLKRKYENILTLANSMTSHFRDVVNSQRMLGDTFADLAQKSSELIDDFTINCETQRQLVKNGELLLDNLNQFTSNIRTLCHKTIEDTLVTIKCFETARLEYDAFRSDLEYLKSTATTESANEQKSLQIRNLEDEVATYHEKYERLKSDVTIKMKFLDENRIKVMKKQLALFQSAIYSYFQGNQQALESIMKQFQFKSSISSSNSQQSAQSFLEQS